MKIISGIVLIGAVFVAVFIFGCAERNSNFGQPITETNSIPIGDILAHPEQFENKLVRIEGKITDECPAGGWFFLKDGTGMVYVNLHPSYFAIPQSVGHRIVVQGVVRKEGTQIEVIGKGAKLK